ncbi:DUF4238 domain-containing protein [Acinetobacter sp. WCHAc060025]|uniref:DUF4238 domain-containing protein n=1 Tax=Acinetobacter sp. WCHAc060025 TaxID=2518625 RepID=UPI001022D2AB|nr:DUF4238 domain-containing protein [Acinetobacter sp. WCHAc060025]RZG73637.1 DUF4238 domain-containing protein [Acinetobacter sp. WCHAc060025]
MEFKPKDLELKRENHYVWANYLKNWSLNNSDVWYTTKKLKIACDSVKAIAKEKDFYKYHYISRKHLDLILSLSKLSPEELQALHKSYLDPYLQLQTVESLCRQSGIRDEKLFAYIEAFKSNTIENLHTAHEKNVDLILKSLQRFDLTILDSTQNMCNFMCYWGHQIARTKPFRDKIIAAQTDQELQKLYKESWWFIGYIFGTNIGKSFFETRNIDKHCLLINETDEDFITSDHPIINVHEAINENDLAVPNSDEADFFYAISPRLGYMINKSDRFKNGINYISIDFVQEINKKLAIYADQYIIGTNEAQLQNYKKFVGKRLNIIKNLKNTST